MQVTGSCHCGDIAFEAEVDPAGVGICHCTDCQQLTGTAFRVTVFASDKDFRLIKGEPATYLKKTADSGNPRAQGFCGKCGSHLYATTPGDGPKVYGLRVGTLDQRRELPPQKQVWTHSAVDWLDAITALPAKPKA